MSLTGLEKAEESEARLDARPPVPSIDPYPNSIPNDYGVLVYYKLEDYSGWSSPDLESARAEARRFDAVDRRRPRILKITETVEVVN